MAGRPRQCRYVGWTVNTADNGLTVNGNNVDAYGIFVEHYQKTEVQWNGNNGYFAFFQNELPYDPPSAAAWMNGSQVGYPAIQVASTVTNFTGYGWGSYCYFNVTPSITAYHSFNVPTGSRHPPARHPDDLVGWGRQYPARRQRHGCADTDEHHAGGHRGFP